jgi:quinol monooxygenase YgiN
MLVNAVIYTFPAELADEAARLLHELRDASRAEAGCIGYEVARANAEPGVFVLYETWADQAALDAHYAMEHFVRLGVNGLRKIALSRLAHQCSPLP